MAAENWAGEKAAYWLTDTIGVYSPIEPGVPKKRKRMTEWLLDQVGTNTSRWIIWTYLSCHRLAIKAYDDNTYFCSCGEKLTNLKTYIPVTGRKWRNYCDFSTADFQLLSCENCVYGQHGWLPASLRPCNVFTTDLHCIFAGLVIVKSKS